MLSVKKMLLLAGLAVMAGRVPAQEPVTLHIGDAPPAIQYSKWIKGTPVASFDGDRLYVLEFWATWCGPCKAAMPHLTELQKQYQGKAAFIGVGVWEHVGEDKPYESSLPSVEKFVNGNAANMGYSVIADNNAQFMANNWLKAAGINGIPSTFIIKNNKIVWIGHPIALDTTLPKIMDGSYDMQAYKAAYEKRSEASRKQGAEMMAAMKPVQDALKAKDYTKAFALMEKAKADVPILKISMDNMKFTTLLKNVSQEQAMAFAKEWAKDFNYAPAYVVSAVSAEDNLSPATYLAAAKNYEDAKMESNPVGLHMLALCYSKGGDYKNAVANEEKAVEGAKTALKEGKMVGTIMDYTVTEYEEALASYKKAVKKPFTIEGTMKGREGGWVYLMYTNDEMTTAYTMDSALVSHGRFSFKGAVEGPAQATVAMDKTKYAFDKYATLYIVPAVMQLSLDYHNFSNGAVLKGSPVQDEAAALNKAKAPVMDKLTPLGKAYDKANMAYIDAIREKKDSAALAALKDKAEAAKEAMEPYQEQLRKIDMSFIEQHPASFVTASMMRWYVSSMPLEKGEAIYDKFPDTIKGSGLGKAIRAELDKIREGSSGSKAYVFTGTELRGAPLSLADYKGKYVLVDFWASWCVPCRKGNPHLLSLYAKYKNKGKGLEIIGISDDDSKPEAWRKAVEKDGTGVWKHVLRGLKQTPGGGFDRSADISEHYGISSLPTKILINPDGVIVGRFGGGGEDDEAMDKKLAAIFGEPVRVSTKLQD